MGYAKSLGCSNFMQYNTGQTRKKNRYNYDSVTNTRYLPSKKEVEQVQGVFILLT